MTRKYIPVLILLSVLVTGCHQQAPETGAESLFPHAALSLMPGGEPDNLEAYLPLHPGIIAWGSDPVHQELDRSRYASHVNAQKETGLQFIAGNVWMLTATERFLYAHPEYQEAVCVDLNGDRIVPGWLDSEYRGIKPWWGCTNHPDFRAHLEERAAVAIEGGANMLHLDDHMGTCAAALHSGGCFCSYCEAGFRKWLKAHYSADELRTKGITSLDSFTYAGFLKSEGIRTREAFISGGFNHAIPLYTDFIAYQRKAAADFVDRLGIVADSVAGKNIPVGVNSWNLTPEQLATSHHADYFSNEVQHYEKEDLVPPFVYLLGNALGKPVFSTGTGEDWIHMNTEMDPVRINRWIATAYAFGNYFMYAYRSWGFSEETGTRWTKVPVELFAPYFSFIHDNAALFDGYEPYVKTAVLYDNAAARNGDMRARDLCKKLHDANIPVSLAVRGDDWLQFETQPEALAGIAQLVVPSRLFGSNDLPAFAQRFKEEGSLVIAEDSSQIPDLLAPPIEINGAAGVWTLPRVAQKDGKEHLVIHLLNQDYLEATDEMVVKQSFELRIQKDFWPAAKNLGVNYYTPGGEVFQLETIENNNSITVTVPTLDVWGIVAFS